MDPFLGLLNERHPGVPAIGGMASGAHGPGQTLLFTSRGLREGGAVGEAYRRWVWLQNRLHQKLAMLPE